jgi:Zn-dependent protease with chaperone function
MTPLLKRLRHPDEPVYSALLYAFGGFFWLILALAFIGALVKPDPALIADFILYGIGIPLFFFLSAGIYRAHAYGNMIRLGPTQWPTLYDHVVKGADSIGLPQTPEVFLYNSNGIMNAFARRLLGARFVFLTSALVDVQDDAQVKFVIGHELGHHAAGHLDPLPTILRAPGHFTPFLGPAYSRTREFTCDQVGAYLSQNPAKARSSLAMLGCGCKRFNDSLNLEAFAAQDPQAAGPFGFLSEIFRSHPRLTRRVAAIRDTQ